MKKYNYGYRMLPVKSDTYSYVKSQTKPKESFDKTLKRLLKIKEDKNGQNKI